MPVGRDDVLFVKEMDELNILTRADGKGLGHVVREPSSFFSRQKNAAHLI